MATLNPMINSSYNLLIILGGHAVKEGGRWRSTRFAERDQFSCLGDYVRPIAAALLYQKNPRLEIGICGTTRKRGWPGTVHIIQRELLQLGVPKNRITTIGQGISTYWQLVRSQKQIQKKDIVQASLISNRYHLPRIKAMIKNLPDLVFIKTMLQKQRLRLISAEDILILEQPQEWKRPIREFYRSPQAKERIKLEKQGIQEIKTGQYQFRHA